ncbi:chemotaxis protein CheW [Trinickia acidisoli]|uniref:chemotaxis protein CheW n=1 Tax=Trinickia acidisoli TaxID=2767482 RepID=UPI001A8E71BE|nr:chemotaxis protein CheW [Trinickia acidisoli]
MTHAKPGTRGTALAMREDFDQSFARRLVEDPPRESLLAVRVGGDPYAIRIADILGLHVDRHVVALPSARREFLGVAGFRGQIAPVYDLAAMLGYTRARPAMPRWMVSLRHGEPIAFAFDAFDHLFTVEAQHVARSADAERAGQPDRPHLRDVAHDGTAIRPIIQLQSTLSVIQGFCGPSFNERSDEQ